MLAADRSHPDVASHASDEFLGVWLVLTWASLGWFGPHSVLWHPGHPVWLGHDAAYVVSLIGAWMLAAVVVRGLVRRCPALAPVVDYECPQGDADEGTPPGQPHPDLQSSVEARAVASSHPRAAHLLRVGRNARPSEGDAVKPSQHEHPPGQNMPPDRHAPPEPARDAGYRSTPPARNPYGVPRGQAARVFRASRSPAGTPDNWPGPCDARSRANPHPRPGVSQSASYQGVSQFVQGQQRIHRRVARQAPPHQRHPAAPDWFRYAFGAWFRYPVAYFLSWGLALGGLRLVWH